MAAVLALWSAVTYGVGDFLGGMATKRAPAAAVLLWSHLVGGTLLVVVTVVAGGDPTARDLVLGTVGGLAGAAGVGLLYQGLAIGRMSVVAPVTALLAALVPVVAGVAAGERPELAVAIGMVAALAAVVLVSAEGGGGFRPSDVRAVTLALGAGLGFGFFFVALAHTSDASGMWPLVGARVASVTVVGSLTLAGRIDARVPAGPPRLLTAGAGVLDVAANALYLLAIREGLISVVSVLASLYPVSTVVLARLILGERFERLQRVGMVIAVPAAVLMAM